VELTPRLQETLSIVKSSGEISVTDLALQLRVSEKTARSYVKDLARLGYLEEVGDNRVRFKEPGGTETIDRLRKFVELHEAELRFLKTEVERLREEVSRLKRFAALGK